MHGAASRAVLLALLLLVVGVPLRAQRLTGTVVDATTRQPITLALVVLVDSAGAVVQRVLTTDAGRFIITPRATGRFQLRIERIGYATVTEPFFSIATDTDRDFQIAVNAQAITLDGIAVTGEQVCAINTTAGETLRVWTEARKALAAAVVAQQQQVFSVEGISYRRLVNADAAVIEHTQDPLRSTNRQLYRSLSASYLTEHGYIHEVDREYTFLAPDAEVLLSTEFEAAHCFTLTRDRATPELIGVRFAPNRRQRVSEVAGVLWLHARTSALRVVSFGYVNAPSVPYVAAAEGRVEFQLLPNGGFVLARWWIRMPATVAQGRERDTVTEFWEEGGEVRAVGTADRRWTVVPPAVIDGVVLDSVRGGVRAAAAVTLLGSNITARTDDSGRFRIGDLPAGGYTIALADPLLDSLPPYPAESTARLVRIATGDTAHVTLVVPPLARSALGACMRAGWRTGDRVHVYGAVLDAATGARIRNGRLRLSWDSIYEAGGQVRMRRRAIDVDTDEQGAYVACSLPASRAITIELLTSERIHERVQLHTGDAQDGLLQRTLLFPRGGQDGAVARAPLPSAAWHPDSAKAILGAQKSPGIVRPRRL